MLDADTRTWSQCLSHFRGTGRFEHLGVSGRPAELFVAEFIDDRFIKQITGEGLLKQLYPGGIPTR